MSAILNDGPPTASGDTHTPAMLSMRRISKAFPGVQALRDVNLEVRAGRIHAIVGENGAGKSTLMKILAGAYAPSSGSIEIDGQTIAFANPLDAQRLGIRMVYQELNLVPDLSVAENICLGQMTRRRGLLDRKAMMGVARRALAELDAHIDPNERLGDLSVSQQQLVEIAKAYAADPRIIVLDEPTSSLSEHEAQILFRILRTMRAKGIAIIYISHRLREVLDIADDVTVLRDGQQIDSRAVAGLTPQHMIRLMVGRDLVDLFPKHHVPIGKTVLAVDGLSRAGVFEDVSLEVRAGEIVGLAGLVGAGRTEFARALFGLDRADAGRVLIRGEEIDIRRPRDGLAHGIGYVPEDRKGDGIVPSMTIRENITLAILGQLTRLGFVRRVREQEIAAQSIGRFGIVPPNPERRIDTLSGGNQQKVVLAKWLAAKPTVLILDEPTRGVDVGAKADIHNIIGDLAAQGVGIIMISSELPEVLAVSDRVVVLHEGRASAPLERSELSEERIMALATGEERP
jgi:ABC-type sugar transport system ATPase subunit